LPQEVDLFQVIKTLRAVRDFRPDPVERSKIEAILSAAIMAPNAGNLQPWQFVVVDDAELKRKVREIALRGWLRFMRIMRIRPEEARVYAEGRRMVEDTDRVPALIFVFGDPAPLVGRTKGIARLALMLRIPFAWRQLELNLAASVYPAAQNILLSAKALGLGACPTTGMVLREAEVKRTLGVPKRLRLFWIIYLGYPVKDLGPPKRRPLREFLHYNQW